MDMLGIHNEAIISENARYHEFLAQYSAGAETVYGFVEGVQDPCYYRGLIDHELPPAWRVRLWPAGGKEFVYRIYRLFDWSRFSKRRICFFVDRDFRGLISEEYPEDVNIYVTDDYSVENSLVNDQTCHRVLTEVCGFVDVPGPELDEVLRRFEEQYETFLEAMLPVTAWLLTCKRRGRTVRADDIRMCHLFAVVDGEVRVNTSPLDCDNVEDYLHVRCSVPMGEAAGCERAKRELQGDSMYRRFVRGKFALWFLVEFCLSVRRAAAGFFFSCDGPPKMRVSMGQSNAMVLVGSRGRIPETLRVFLRDTFGSYVGSERD